jgi:predicted dehydrogenase
MMNAERLRVGLVGYGDMGRRWARVLAGSPGVEVVGVAVGTLAGVERVRAERPWPAFTRLEDLLERARPRALVVASPTEHHHPQVGLALERGLPCLVEKPMAASLEQARDLVARQGAARAPLVIGHSLVFAPSFLRLLALLCDPRVGELRGFSLASTVRPGAGWSGPSRGYWTREFVANLLLHRVALANRLGGGVPDEVRLRRVELTPGGESIQADLVYPGLGACRFSLALGEAPDRVQAQVQTARGGFTWRAGEGGEGLEWTGGDGAARPVRFLPGEPLANALECFLEAVRCGEARFEGARAGLEAMQVTERLVAPLFDEPLRVTLRALAEEPVDSARGPAPTAPLGDDWRSFLEPEVVYSRWPEPEEVAFRLGLKPVLYRTVPEAQAEAVRARFPGAAVAEVRYGLARDPLQDRRARGEGGEPWVDLFLSSDAALARRAAEIYNNNKIGEAVAEMGRLLGYPECCVTAFECLPDRSNNSFLRYATRLATLSRGQAFQPCLNNLHLVATPWYPCSYGCEASAALSRRVLAALEDPAPLLELLSRPVLYFDDTRMVLFRGQATPDEVRYSSVSVPPARGAGREPALAAFVEAVVRPISRGVRLSVDRDALRVWAADGALLHALPRPHPSLGLLFPFSATAADDGPGAGSMYLR